MKSWRKWAVAIGLTLGLGFAFSSPVVSANMMAPAVRLGGDAAQTRVVLDIPESTDARVNASEDGRTLTIDFTRIDTVRTHGEGSGLVSAWRLDARGPGARLTLELSAPAVVDRRFLLSPGDGVDHYRYVIDLTSNFAAGQPRDEIMAVLASHQVPPPAPPPAARRNEKRVIVIDAGHGGRDPGALGQHVQEKVVTLETARALKARLEATGRYDVVLTRTDDSFIELEDRVRVSRRANADLFISLHADAGANARTRGASVYTLSDQGSDRVARRAESNSNWAIDVSLPGGNEAVRGILFDLTQRATRNKSAAFAQLLISRVETQQPLLTRAHRDAGYVVLFAPDVPAVLLEMGFITNPEDEASLMNPAHRQRMAASIAEAIDAYFLPEMQTAAL